MPSSKVLLDCTVQDDQRSSLRGQRFLILWLYAWDLLRMLSSVGTELLFTDSIMSWNISIAAHVYYVSCFARSSIVLASRDFLISDKGVLL